jgi:hypothetical protein
MTTGTRDSARPPAAATSSEDWRELPGHTVGRATDILGGCSTAKVYQLVHAGVLEAVTIAGRTIIKTSSLVRVIDNAPTWRSSTTRGVAARAKRAAIAAARARSREQVGAVVAGGVDVA